jgi:hypothetical protein
MNQTKQLLSVIQNLVTAKTILEQIDQSCCTQVVNLVISTYTRDIGDMIDTINSQIEEDKQD